MCKTAMQITDNIYPFYAIIGNTGKPNWADTAIAYSTFYHLIHKGVKFEIAAEAMKKASGNDGFGFITANKAQESYKDYIKNIELKDILSAVNKWPQAKT